MSAVKSLTTQIKGRDRVIPFPAKKTIILRGMLGMDILHIVESLVTCDMTGYYSAQDVKYGFHYNEPTAETLLSFEGGNLRGLNKVVTCCGSIPNIHCIRSIGNSFPNLRSTLLSQSGDLNQVSTVLTHYSSVLSDKQWLRLVTMVNSIVGYDMCRLNGHELLLDLEYDCDISEDGRKIIYLLVAECFLTPEGYSRLLLVPDIGSLYPDVQIKLLGMLDNISGHMLTLSTARVQTSDLVSSESIVLINV